MPDWVTVAAVADIPPGESKTVDLPAEIVAIFNVDGEFFAVSNQCPHAAGPLVEGFIEKGRVVCPWHGWSFPLGIEDAPVDGLGRYAVRVEGDDIQIDIAVVDGA